jgi:CheY-like chemotaxis protein
MSRPVRILVVEDNPADALLVEEALKEGRHTYDLHVAQDGVAALDYLRREGQFSSVKTPDLVLLDLNLPRMDGRALLEKVKRDPDLHEIPIIVLTTSSDQADIARAYHLHANCYLVKPLDFEGFWRTVRCIEDFWLTLVRLPRSMS